jgi:hypothetical protein
VLTHDLEAGGARARSEVGVEQQQRERHGNAGMDCSGGTRGRIGSGKGAGEGGILALTEFSYTVRSILLLAGSNHAGSPILCIASMPLH